MEAKQQALQSHSRGPARSDKESAGQHNPLQLVRSDKEGAGQHNPLQQIWLEAMQQATQPQAVMPRAMQPQAAPGSDAAQQVQRHRQHSNEGVQGEAEKQQRSQVVQAAVRCQHQVMQHAKQLLQRQQRGQPAASQEQPTPTLQEAMLAHKGNMQRVQQLLQKSKQQAIYRGGAAMSAGPQFIVWTTLTH